jgi:hypothetical protein
MGMGLTGGFSITPCQFLPQTLPFYSNYPNSQQSDSLDKKLLNAVAMLL